jgi:hypothetical protein
MAAISGSGPDSGTTTRLPSGTVLIGSDSGAFRGGDNSYQFISLPPFTHHHRSMTYLQPLSPAPPCHSPAPPRLTPQSRTWRGSNQGACFAKLLDAPNRAPCLDETMHAKCRPRWILLKYPMADPCPSEMRWRHWDAPRPATQPTHTHTHTHTSFTVLAVVWFGRPMSQTASTVLAVQ